MSEIKAHTASRGGDLSETIHIISLGAGVQSSTMALMAAPSRARVCDPARICWLADVAYVVEEQHQAEYAGIVRLRKVPATRDEIEAWRFGGSTTTEGDE